MSSPSDPVAGDFPVHWRITTRWADNDVYGHVNNVVYYSWFDTAVNGWLMEATGVDTRELPAIGVVAETSCRYLREVSFPDPISIGLGLERLGRTSVIYRLGVFRIGEDGAAESEARAVGRFVHVYVDSQSRAPIPIPEPVRAALDRLAQTE